MSGGITAFGMLGNDRLGDCGVAGRYHVDMTTAVGAGQPVPSFTDQQVEQEYLAYDNGQDSGVVLADYLLWCYQQGKIKAFAPVDHSKPDECDGLMAAGFGLYIGVNLGDADEGAFGSEQPWVGAGNPPDPSLGHCVVVVKAAAVGGMRTVVTWGALQEADNAWFAAAEQGGHFDEAWLVVTTEEQLAAFSPALLADVQALGGTGGGQPAPTPAPPTPSPPEPVPPDPPPPWDELEDWFEELFDILEAHGVPGHRGLVRRGAETIARLVPSKEGNDHVE